MELIIIQNGLFGIGRTMTPLREQLANSLNDKYQVVVCDTISFIQSRDGIRNCGIALFDFVIRLTEECQPLSISFIGLSFGGLIVRHCIGLLEGIGYFENVKPKCYISCAAPHLGITKCNNFMKGLASGLAGQTAKDLLFQDSNHHRLPMLLKMSQLGSKYMRGLDKFEKRVAYGNNDKDAHVPFVSSCFCPKLEEIFVVHSDKFVTFGRLDTIDFIGEKILDDISTNLNSLTWTKKVIEFNTINGLAHNLIMPKAVRHMVKYF